MEKNLESLGAVHLSNEGAVDFFSIKRSALSLLFNSDRDKNSIGLLNELRDKFPAIYLWIDVNDDVSRLIEPTEAVSGERLVGRLREDVKFEQIISSNNNSGWALIYFSDMNAEAPKDLRWMPIDPKALESLVVENNISAMIISWYDDTEWLAVFKR